MALLEVHLFPSLSPLGPFFQHFLEPYLFCSLPSSESVKKIKLLNVQLRCVQTNAQENTADAFIMAPVVIFIPFDIIHNIRSFSTFLHAENSEREQNFQLKPKCISNCAEDHLSTRLIILSQLMKRFLASCKIL